jgi:uncharacterized protein (TIGR02246 family)
MNKNEFDDAAIGTALAELAERVQTAYKNNDSELYASTLHEDAIISVPGAGPVRGREALTAAFESRPQLPPDATFEVEVRELEIISADWAYAFGTDTITIPGAAGIVQTMTFMVLLRRTRDGWKTFREVLSADQ